MYKAIAIIDTYIKKNFDRENRNTDLTNNKIINTRKFREKNNFQNNTLGREINI